VIAVLGSLLAVSLIAVLAVLVRQKAQQRANAELQAEVEASYFLPPLLNPLHRSNAGSVHSAVETLAIGRQSIISTQSDLSWNAHNNV
jgi:hypothetical protein